MPPTTEYLSANLPPEPPVGSVVIGEATGRAYQLVATEKSDSLWCCPTVFGAKSWFRLLEAERGVVAIWRPDEDAGPAPAATTGED